MLGFQYVSIIVLDIPVTLASKKVKAELQMLFALCKS